MGGLIEDVIVLLGLMPVVIGVSVPFEEGHRALDVVGLAKDETRRTRWDFELLASYTDESRCGSPFEE